MGANCKNQVKLIARWLFGAAQCRDGTASGGIYGWWDGDDPSSSRFVYGEITGYWLTWLTWLRQFDVGEDFPIEQSARAAIGFLERALDQNGNLPTRLYEAPQRLDWRNQCRFSFDQAMMLRGLAQVSTWVDPERCRKIGKIIASTLQEMIIRGELTACNTLEGEPPDTWSTQPGPFQLKTAAAILLAPPDWLGQTLLQATDDLVTTWVSRDAEQAELHPRCYALEGETILRGAADSRRIAILVEAVLSQNHRVDVLAQSLRLDLIHDAGEKRGLCERLNAGIRPDGSCAFTVGDSHMNVWTGMFASQALALAWAGSDAVIDRSLIV